MFMHRIVPVILVVAMSPLALADNPLVISGEVSDTDSISYFLDGAGNSFYYDLVRINIDTEGTYNFEMDPGQSLSPWFGVTADGDFDTNNYDDTPFYIQEGDAPTGVPVSRSVDLLAGVYEVSMGSWWYIEQGTGQNLGEYTMTISGPDGAQITVVPAPAAGLALLGGLLGCQRRTRRA